MQFFQNTGTLSQTRQVIINGATSTWAQTTSATAAATSVPILLKGDLNIHGLRQQHRHAGAARQYHRRIRTPRKLIKNDANPARFSAEATASPAE